MRKTVLKINSFDIGPYLKEDGIKVSFVTRNEKSFITMDGTKHQKQIDKLSLSIDVLDMSDSQFTEFCSHLKPNPAEVAFRDFERDLDYQNVLFYVSAPVYNHKKSIDEVTYIDGISFSIEEK